MYISSNDKSISLMGRIWPESWFPTCDKIERLLDLHEVDDRLGETCLYVNDCVVERVTKPIVTLTTGPDEAVEGDPVKKRKPYKNKQSSGEPKNPDEGPRNAQIGHLTEYDMTRVVVSEHRGVIPGRQDNYVSSVLCEVKTRFGCMERTDANIRVVRRFANNIMVRDKLRPAHRARYLPLVIELSFHESTSEIQVANDVRNYVRWRNSWWRWLFDGKSRGSV